MVGVWLGLIGLCFERGFFCALVVAHGARWGALFWALCGDVSNVDKCVVFERFMGLLWLLGAVVVGLVCGGWE